MRKLSRMMISLLLGATLVAPVAAQAQEDGRGRGGWQRGGGEGGQRGGWQRGGGDDAGQRGGWQRGGGDTGQGGGWQRGDRGSVMNDMARREAIQQAREARRQVERPAPVMQTQTPDTDVRRQWRGNRGDGDGGRAQATENRVERHREMQDTNRDPNRWNNRGGDRADRERRGDGDGDRRRDWNRDGNRDGGRNWAGDRRDWNRDGYRNWDRSGNRSWSSDRRDWDRNDDRRWNRDWRSDRRYSWQDYRSRNRNIYRLPRYEDRYGYSYRRWYAGYRWDPWFYSASFWISDPWQYRLPPAYGPYRWVRYYDDVVLVDIETGEIVDIIYDFFW